MLSDRMKEIRAAVEASPSKVALIFTRDHQDNEPGSLHASMLPLSSGERGYDHVAAAWLDEHGELVFGEMRLGETLTGYGKDWEKPALGSISLPGTSGELVTEYGTVDVVPIDLSRYGPDARDAFVKALDAALQSGNTYSFAENGRTCASAVFDAWKAIPGIEKVLGGETGQFSLAEWMTALREGYPILDAPLKELETHVDGIKLNIVTPNHIHGLAKEHSVPFSFSADPIDRDNGAEGNQAENASYINFKEMLQGGWDNFRETFPNAADYFAKLLLELAGQEESFFGAAADVKLGMPDVVVPKAVVQEALQGLWDDFSEAFPEAAEALAEHLVKTYGEPAPFGSYSFQLKAAIPDILDKLAQPAAMPETATAEIGVDPVVHDQAEPQVATSAAVISDDGFSFSAFIKQENAAEVAKAAVPAEQLSPEDIPGSGVSAGDNALPDAGSEDVGNAAPTKEPVVHHGDLAP